ncbi:unnamed protein product [Meloidogyne enterolobii]|uniref:Uncharacterized protein n=1 Tax=Meloidogyne enterolobii TaxID=390850 RepID=A0ACB0YX86_MELEN
MHRRNDEPVLIHLIPGTKLDPIDRSFVRLSGLIFFFFKFWNLWFVFPVFFGFFRTRLQQRTGTRA